MDNNDDLHRYHMSLALEEAAKALDRREFPVGCVIADEDGVICTGSREKSIEDNEMDHAEIVALRRLYKRFPSRLGKELTVYATMEPCLMCFSALILNNVRTIVYAYEDAMGGGTGLELERLAPLYAAMKITIVPHVLREKSVKLFKQFFSDPGNTYLRGSQLAAYTLAQKLR